MKKHVEIALIKTVKKNICLSSPAAPNVDESQVSQMVEMGFPRNACVKGVYFTKNAGVEQAMNWVMEHMDDLGEVLPYVE